MVYPVSKVLNEAVSKKRIAAKLHQQSPFPSLRRYLFCFECVVFLWIPRRHPMSRRRQGWPWLKHDCTPFHFCLNCLTVVAVYACEELDLVFRSAMQSGIVDAEEGEMIRSVRNLDSKRIKAARC